MSPTGSSLLWRNSEEWREFGFHYYLIDEAREWRLTGSRDGLVRFAEMIHDYITDASSAGVSQHTHLGPHMYLVLMTWTEAGIDGDAIFGSLEDLGRLEMLVRDRLANAVEGQSIEIGDDYKPGSEYSLVLDVREPKFDPSSLDSQLDAE